MFFNYKNQRGGFAFFCISAFFALIICLITNSLSNRSNLLSTYVDNKFYKSLELVLNIIIMSKLWDTKHLFYRQARFFMIFRGWMGKQTFHLCVRCFSFSFLFHPFTFCFPVLARGGFMITLLIILLIMFGGKDSTHHGFDAEEDDYEEMLIMGMIDDD